MELMKLRELTPKRSEDGEQIGWTEKDVLVNPSHFLGAEYSEHAKQVIVSLVAGHKFFVEESLEKVNQKFHVAMTQYYVTG